MVKSGYVVTRDSGKFRKFEYKITYEEVITHSADLTGGHAK